MDSIAAILAVSMMAHRVHRINVCSGEYSVLLILEQIQHPLFTESTGSCNTVNTGTLLYNVQASANLLPNQCIRSAGEGGSRLKHLLHIKNICYKCLVGVSLLGPYSR